MDPTYPSIPLFNFIGVALAVIPLPWQLQSWNVGAASFSIWAALQCLDCGIRFVVWRSNTNNVIPVYCDISTRFQVAVGTAIPSCSLAINRRLFNITRTRDVGKTREERRKSIIFDLCLCVLWPLFTILLYYCVQSSRFAISEDMGCSPTYLATVEALILMYLPALITSIISASYMPFILIALNKRHKEMDQFYDENSVQSFSRSRYFRLMALACIDIFISIPTEIFLMTEAIISSKSLFGGHIPASLNWHDIHATISDIFFVPADEWRTSLNVGVYQYANWMNFVFSLIFFLIFGTTRDMIDRYKNFFWTCVRPFGLKRREHVPQGLPPMQFEAAPPPITGKRRTMEATNTTIASSTISESSIPDDYAEKCSGDANTVTVVAENHDDIEAIDAHQGKGETFDYITDLEKQH